METVQPERFIRMQWMPSDPAAAREWLTEELGAPMSGTCPLAEALRRTAARPGGTWRTLADENCDPKILADARLMAGGPLPAGVPRCDGSVLLAYDDSWMETLLTRSIYRMLSEDRCNTAMVWLDQSSDSALASISPKVGIVDGGIGFVFATIEAGTAAARALFHAIALATGTLGPVLALTALLPPGSVPAAGQTAHWSAEQFAELADAATTVYFGAYDGDTFMAYKPGARHPLGGRLGPRTASICFLQLLPTVPSPRQPPARGVAGFILMNVLRYFAQHSFRDIRSSGKVNWRVRSLVRFPPPAVHG